MVIERGIRLVEIAQKWGNGFSMIEGIECEIVGDRSVGGSYLTARVKRTVSEHARSKRQDFLSWFLGLPHTHYKNLEILYRYILVEYIRKAQQAAAITCRAFRENYDRASGFFSDVID